MSLFSRRQLLAVSSGALLASALPAPPASAQARTGTRLVLGDQSEFLRNLLAASDQAKTLDFALETPNFAGGPAILEAMRAGALDLAYVGDVPPIQARASGTLLPIVLTASRARSEYKLTARGGLTIDRLAQLKGKRVSYVEGSGRQVYLVEALNRAGLSLDDVERVPLRVADLPDAIRTGAVDVAVLQEPHVTRLAHQVGARLVTDPEVDTILPGTWYFYARPEALADPRKSAEMGQLLAAIIRAGLWANRNPETWGAAYYTRFQRIPAEDTAAILAAQSPLDFQTSTEAIPHHQRLIDILAGAGELPRAFDAAGSFTASFDPLIAAARQEVLQ